MHPEISLFPNFSFYNNNLLNADMVCSQQRIPPVLLQLPQPLSWMRHYAFIDVPHSLDAERKGVNHSFVNRGEAEVADQKLFISLTLLSLYSSFSCCCLFLITPFYPPYGLLLHSL